MVTQLWFAAFSPSFSLGGSWLTDMQHRGGTTPAAQQRPNAYLHPGVSDSAWREQWEKSGHDRRWVARRVAEKTLSPDELKEELPTALTHIFGVPVQPPMPPESLNKSSYNASGDLDPGLQHALDASGSAPSRRHGEISAALAKQRDKASAPLLLGTENSKWLMDMIVDAVINGRPPSFGGDPQLTAVGPEQSRRPGAGTGGYKGLLEAVMQLKGYEPCRFPSMYLPSVLQGRGGGQWGGEAFCECSPIELLTYTLAVYPMYVASEFPVWDLERPWTAGESAELFDHEYSATMYKHGNIYSSYTPPTGMQGDPYLRILDKFLDVMLSKGQAQERAELLRILAAFWLCKPRPNSVLQQEDRQASSVRASECLETKCRDVLASPGRRHLQAVMMLARKVVNLPPALVPGSSPTRHHEPESLLHHHLVPPLYAFLRWSLASLHVKLTKGEYLQPSILDKMRIEGEVEAQYKITAREALYRTLDIWEVVLTPTAPLDRRGSVAAGIWLTDYMHHTALFSTVLLYDVVRTLRVLMQAWAKSSSAPRVTGSANSDPRIIIQRLDRILDLPASSLGGVMQVLKHRFLEALTRHITPIMGPPQPNTSKDLEAQRRARKRGKLQRWRIALQLRTIIVDLLAGRTFDFALLVARFSDTDRQLFLTRCDAVRQHLKKCLVDCGLAFREIKCQTALVCGPHLHQTFSQQAQHTGGSGQMCNILERDREQHSLVDHHVLCNSYMLSLLGLERQGGVYGRGGTSVLGQYSSPNKSRGRNADWGSGIGDGQGGQGAEDEVLAWQLYHEVDSLQEELLRLARQRQEEDVVLGHLHRLKRWVHQPGYLAVEATRLLLPGIISFGLHTQLQQLVAKLDLFWDAPPDQPPLVPGGATVQGTLGAGALGSPTSRSWTENPGTGSDGGGRERGRLWNRYPVSKARLSDGDPKSLHAGVAGGRSDGEMTARGESEVLCWQMREQTRQVRLRPRGELDQRAKGGNDTDVIHKLKQRLGQSQVAGEGGGHVSLASLLLSPAQRGLTSTLALRDERQLSSQLPFRPDASPLSTHELDAKVRRERFLTTAWLPPAGGCPDGQSEYLKDLNVADADMEAVWQRVSGGDDSVSLAALVALFSPDHHAVARARKRLVVRSGGRASFLFGGPGENQARGGPLPLVSPHGTLSALSADCGGSLGAKRVLVVLLRSPLFPCARSVSLCCVPVVLWHGTRLTSKCSMVSGRCNRLLGLPWFGTPGNMMLVGCSGSVPVTKHFTSVREHACPCAGSLKLLTLLSIRLGRCLMK